MKADIVKMGAIPISIIHIGTVDSILPEEPTGWIFDCKGHIPAIEIRVNGPTLYGGYTATELMEILMAAAREENGKG